MKTNYKGFEIIKTYRHGYTYWKIAGENTLYSTMKGAKIAIDSKVEA